MNKELLLSDEVSITEENYKERIYLKELFGTLPSDFFSKLRHFQPQVGCLNACSICSKYASTNVSGWSENRIRNVIAALKYSTPAKKLPLIVWHRENHRNGVIFSYLDNDVGFYDQLDKFIKIAYDELGVKTRVSTVGFSRHNDNLNIMHKQINNYPDALGGVRLSFTPYEIGWSCNSKQFSREEYEKDIINFLKIYRPYFEYIGSGSRNFCVELRYKPFVVNEDVNIFEDDGYFIISSGKYLYVSNEQNIKFENTYIQDPFNHRLSLSNEGQVFNKILLDKKLSSQEEILTYLKDNIDNIEKTVVVYQVTNKDGLYYSIDPKLTDGGNYGINIYPKIELRKKSGYIVTERYFLNALFDYKKEKGLSSTDNFLDATWDDVKNVLLKVKNKMLDYYQNNEVEKYEYIKENIMPMLLTYTRALYEAGYSPDNFFDRNFTIDTGIICNLGRAIHEFKGLVSIENEPLTLNHERNYGNVKSTMTEEGVAWRLSCDYDNTLIIEELDLASTATMSGQTRYHQIVKLEANDEILSIADIKNTNLIPGQRRVENGN